MLAAVALIVHLALSPAAFAPGDSLSGRIVDPDGKPIADAVVTIAELGRSTKSRRDGTFQIGALPAGHYTLAVRSIGHAAKVAMIDDQTRDRAVTIVLESSPFQVEPLVVTASRAPDRRLESPLATSVLSQDALREEQSVSIAQAIAHLPGVRALTTGTEIAKPVIRGLTGQRVLVLEDGNRLEDYSWSDEDGPSIDARLTDRIEVIRGPASLLYGSDALAGVVNAITAPLPDGTSGNPYRRRTVELYGASNNGELGAALELQGAKNRLGWRLGGVFRRAEAIHTPAGELENTGFSALNAEGAIGIRGDRGNIALHFSHYGCECKLLEANGPPPGAEEGEEEGPERKAQDDRFQLAVDRVAGSWRLEGKGQYQRHSLIEVSDDTPGSTPGAEAAAFDLLLNTISADVMAHRVSDRFRLSVGVNGLHQSNDTRGPIPLVPDATTNSAAAFSVAEVKAKQWSVLAGARFDTRKVEADANPGLSLTDQHRTWNAFAGNVGVVFRPIADLALSANVGRGWRAPNLFELFANGPHLGEARYERGNAMLETERSTTAEASIRLERRTVRAELTAYRNAASNFIYITPTTQTIGGLRVYQHTQANARLTGAEGSVEVDVAAVLTLTGRADGVRATNLETDEPLPLTPPLRTAFGADLHRAGLSWAERAHVGVEVEGVARQKRLNALDIPTGGFTLVHLRAGLERPFVGRHTRFDLTIRNLGNASYRDFLSRYKEFALNPGRNVVFRISTDL